MTAIERPAPDRTSPRRHELHGLGRERRRETLPDERDERNEDERRDDRAGDEDTGLPVSEDVADREERRRELHGDLGLR